MKFNSTTMSKQKKMNSFRFIAKTIWDNYVPEMDSYPLKGDYDIAYMGNCWASSRKDVKMISYDNRFEEITEREWEFNQLEYKLDAKDYADISD